MVVLDTAAVQRQQQQQQQQQQRERERNPSSKDGNTYLNPYVQPLPAEVITEKNLLTI